MSFFFGCVLECGWLSLRTLLFNEPLRWRTEGPRARHGTTSSKVSRMAQGSTGYRGYRRIPQDSERPPWSKPPKLPFLVINRSIFVLSLLFSKKNWRRQARPPRSNAIFWSRLRFRQRFLEFLRQFTRSVSGLGLVPSNSRP